MTTNKANNRMLRHAILNHSPERRCHRVPISLREALDGIPVQIRIASLSCKAILKKEQLRCCMVRLGLDLRVTCRIESELVVPKQKLLVPRNYAVADLMAFGPSLLRWRNRIVNQNSLAIRHPKRRQTCLLNHIH